MFVDYDSPSADSQEEGKCPDVKAPMLKDEPMVSTTANSVRDSLAGSGDDYCSNEPIPRIRNRVTLRTPRAPCPIPTGTTVLN